MIHNSLLSDFDERKISPLTFNPVEIELPFYFDIGQFIKTMTEEAVLEDNREQVKWLYLNEEEINLEDIKTLAVLYNAEKVLELVNTIEDDPFSLLIEEYVKKDIKINKKTKKISKKVKKNIKKTKKNIKNIKK